LSQTLDECKPLDHGGGYRWNDSGGYNYYGGSGGGVVYYSGGGGRGLHSFPF
jgi:hypothetical protein